MNRHYNLWAISKSPQAITLTIRDYVCHQHASLDNLFHKACHDIAKRLDRICVKWKLYPELTPDRGILHFHGVIWIKDPIKWSRFVNYYNVNYGFLKIKPIDDLGAWLRYVEKDWFLMQQILRLQPKMYEFDDYINNNSYKRILGIWGASAPKTTLD